jgi:hypothetical protein
MLNRKFAYKDIKKAQFFNNKNIDKPSSIDIWFNIFKNSTSIPSWYWQTKTQNKPRTKQTFKKEDIEDIKERYNLKDKDIDFLILYYEEELKDKIKKIKKFKR